MSATVWSTTKNGDARTRTVKNLGWLVRHASEVHVMHVVDHGDGTATLRAYPERMIVGAWGSYSITFADITVLRDWIKRPCLRHAFVWNVGEVVMTRGAE